MIEHSYTYHTFKADSQGKIDLGSFLVPAALLQNELTPAFDSRHIIDLREISGCCDNYWVGVIVVEASRDIVAYSALQRPIKQQGSDYVLAETFVKPEHRRRGIYKN